MHTRNQAMGELWYIYTHTHTHGFCNSLMTDIMDPFSEFQDIYREDTIKTYQEWLGLKENMMTSVISLS